MAKALKWDEEERIYHRYTAYLWPTLFGIWTGLEGRFVCKRAWQAWAHFSNTDVPFIMIFFEYRANGGRLNKPPIDGVTKFLTTQAKQSGLTLRQWRTGKSGIRATLRIPKALAKQLAVEPLRKSSKKRA